VRAKDLDVHELLHFAEGGGIIAFAGERVLLLDAVALGLLRLVGAAQARSAVRSRC
jgi:two-component system, NtrC family, response regulator HydG